MRIVCTNEGFKKIKKEGTTSISFFHSCNHSFLNAMPMLRSLLAINIIIFEYSSLIAPLIMRPIFYSIFCRKIDKNKLKEMSKFWILFDKDAHKLKICSIIIKILFLMNTFVIFFVNNCLFLLHSKITNNKVVHCSQLLGVNHFILPNNYKILKLLNYFRSKNSSLDSFFDFFVIFILLVIRHEIKWFALQLIFY